MTMLSNDLVVSMGIKVKLFQSKYESYSRVKDRLQNPEGLWLSSNTCISLNMLLYFSRFQLTSSKYIQGLISQYICNFLYQNSSNSLSIVPYTVFILPLIGNGKEVGERLFWVYSSFLEIQCMLTQMLHKKLPKAFKVTLCVLFCVPDFMLLKKIRKEELGDLIEFLPSKQDLI